MSTTFTFLIIFIIALAIGFFIGKTLFSSKSNSEKIILEEKNFGLIGNINDLKSQIENIKIECDKQLQFSYNEKEKIRKELNDVRNEKEAINIQLTKKEVDFENLFEKNKSQKQEVEQLQEKFTKEFENLANKILDEKSNKFTEQN